ncbi:MAG: MarR family winged helix-turn-helix transcriptional regulator [Burkholderiales bacterium]|nr:MarR family winged helix-turn-helix transcriptional regulator [Burkholderiales bacterium]
MTSFYEQHMRQIGLKLSQYSVLANISEQKQTLVQLADRLDMDRTTLTRSLRPLLDQGWVVEAAGDDARQRWLVLTPTGSVFRQKAEAHWRDAQLALESQLGREFVANLNVQMQQALSQLKPALPEAN